jgi:hypothetical protein
VISARSFAVLTCWAYRAGAALAIGLVPARAVAAIVGDHPRGDAVLWDRGGLMLLETARWLPSRGGPLVSASVALLVVVTIGWAFPLGALVAACGTAPPASSSAAFAAGGRCVGRLTLLAGMAMAAEALVSVLFALLFGFAARPFVEARTLPFAVGGAVGLALAWAIAVLADLARAEIVWRDRGAFAAIAGAWRRVWSWRAFLAAAWRTLVGVVALAGIGRLVLLLAPRWPGLAIACALAAGAVPVALRASWFSWLSRREAGGDGGS